SAVATSPGSSDGTAVRVGSTRSRRNTASRGSQPISRRPTRPSRQRRVWGSAAHLAIASAHRAAPFLLSRRSRTLARSSSSQSAARVGTRDASDRVVGRAALERDFLAGSWADYLEVSFVFTTFYKVSTAFLQFYTV